MLSYYADIPKRRKFRKPQCDLSKMPSMKELMSRTPKRCKCATSHRDWYNCPWYPWLSKHDRPEEYFVMMDCPGNSLHVETRVVRNDAILQRIAASVSASAATSHTEEKPKSIPPNILFIEVDSVSLAYANRHFPKTTEFLRKYRIQKNADGTHACKDGICAAEFSNFTITGPNSISNQVSECDRWCHLHVELCDVSKSSACFFVLQYYSQVAALAGCLVSSSNQAHDSCPPDEDRNSTVGDVCKDISKRQYNLRLAAKTVDVAGVEVTAWCDRNDRIGLHSDESPLLFDVAQNVGYVTFFGEEFCYEGSPYIVQDNLFPLQTDFMIHKLHCRLTERTLVLQKGKTTEYIDSLKQEGKLWSEDFTTVQCTDGDTGIEKAVIPLELISQMWNTYSGNSSKFAFVSTLTVFG